MARWLARERCDPDDGYLIVAVDGGRVNDVASIKTRMEPIIRSQLSLMSVEKPRTGGAVCLGFDAAQ